MSQERTPENDTIFQAFEWEVPSDKKHWKRLSSAVEGLKAIGLSTLWLPPACKASGCNSNGYDIYDLYDLGEFDQKGGKPTKWGTKEDLLGLVSLAKQAGVSLLFDAVLNHRAAADKTEKCQVVEVDENDRNKNISEPYEIEAWLGFDFPGRGDKHSSQKYHWEHFSATDYNAANGKKSIYKIVGDNKRWSQSVDKEKGNFDYLMFANLDYAHPEVTEDVKNWGDWVTHELGLAGMRIDAARHISEDFLSEFILNLDSKQAGEGFYVGEFWKDSIDDLCAYIGRMKRKFSLFDVPLVHNFSRLSQTKNADMTKVFEGTLVAREPVRAVTVVTTHDTQPGQACETPMEGFFKPLAYALILLRVGGYPSVFYGDVYGLKGDKPEGPSCAGKLPDICLARKLYAYGEQHDYLDLPQCIGWTREGTWDRPFGLACVMSNAKANEKKMYVGKTHEGEVWTDVVGWEQREVTIDVEGNGVFPCPGVSVAVFVNREAEGRDRFGRFDADIYSKA